MVTRRFATALMLVLAVAGCADNTTESGAAGPAPSASDVIDLPSATPSTEPSAGKPTATGAETITGTVTAGVEPHCLLLQDDKGSHLLVFDDTSLRSSAAVGAKVTLTGRSEPSMMSTCQQGVPFIVTSVSSSGS